AVADHLVPAELTRVSRQGPGEQRPALRDLVGPVLHVVGQPERVERGDGLVVVREGVLDEARPDVEADRDARDAIGGGHGPAILPRGAPRRPGAGLYSA